MKFRVIMRRSYDMYIDVEAENSEDARDEADSFTRDEWHEVPGCWNEEILSVEAIEEKVK